VQGEYRAYRNSCPHAGAPICEGRFRGPESPTGIYPYQPGRKAGTIRCPSHGWDFDLMTGDYVYGYDTLRSYPVSVEGEDIFIELG
jgi:3-phenylpropionate/trans-cinnamate dioxygenase ferredoxin subunit